MMVLRNASWLAIVTIALLAPSAWAAEEADPSAMITRGIQAYQAAMDCPEPTQRIEQFAQAYRCFASAAERGAIRNAELYTNLGNAALQARRLGPAILAYRRALEIDPGHVQARRNLAHARKLLPKRTPTPADESLVDTFLFWTHACSVRAQATAAAGFFAVAAVCVGIALRFKRRWAWRAAVAPLAVWAVMTGTIAWYSFTGGATGVVVTADEAVVRSADSAGAPARLAEPTPGGTEAELLDRRNGWVRIRLADERDGWVRESAVEAVR